MNLMLDTANLDKIKEYLNYFNIDGVTTNPSILKNTPKEELNSTLLGIKAILPKEATLHVQVVALDAEGMYQDAQAIHDLLGKEVSIKVPVTKEGLRVIKRLKEEGFCVTATAIYSQVQALLAINLGADYIAPYINRMQNLNIDAIESIRLIHQYIKDNNAKTRILGASFKNIEQVTQTLYAGADFVTVGEEVLDTFLKQTLAKEAAEDFLEDWQDQFKRDTFN